MNAALVAPPSFSPVNSLKYQAQFDAKSSLGALLN